MTGGTTVYHCPLEACEWTYAQPPPGTEIPETPSVPLGYAVTLDEAITQGAFATMRDWLAGADRVLEAHLKTHSLLEWVQEVAALRDDLGRLLAVAGLYLDAFSPDELMTLPEKLAFQGVEEVVKRRGKRYYP